MTRAARRGPRARRLAPHPRAPQRQGDRHATCSPTTSPRSSSPPFTFHGFRYAEVETDAELLDAEVVAISSDTPRRATFACVRRRAQPAPRERRVVAARQLRVRPDRLPAARRAAGLDRRRPGLRGRRPRTLFDAEAFWRSWLRDLALEQDDVLGVPTVVPDVVLDGRAALRAGRLGGRGDDRAVGRVRVVRRRRRPRRPVRRACVAGSTRSSARRGATACSARSLQFGDWLDPDAPSDRAVGGEGRLRSYLANAFFVAQRPPDRRRARLARRRHVAEPRYARLADDDRLRATWAPLARARAHDPDRLRRRRSSSGVAPDGERAAVGDALARLVREADGRVATGFLGHAARAARRSPRRGTSTRRT